jgi:hypothetical protein
MQRLFYLLTGMAYVQVSFAAYAGHRLIFGMAGFTLIELKAERRVSIHYVVQS